MNKIRVWVPMYGFYSYYGGAEKQLEKIANQLGKIGYEITVISTKANNEEKSFLGKEFNIKLLPLLYRGKLSLLKKLASLLFMIELLLYLLINRNKYDVLQNFFVDKYSFVTILCGLILNKPVIIRESNSKSHLISKKSKLQRLIYKFYNKASALIAISEQIKQEYIDLFGIDSGKIVFINNGVELIEEKNSECLRNSLSLPVNKKIIINVGSLSKQKNHIKLFKSWKKLIEKDKNYVLICLGEGNKRDELTRFIHENKIDENVLLLGNKNNVSDYLLASDMFIFPSLWEGMPNALIEAMSAGLPCIASDIEANSLIIENNKNGILFDLNISDEKLADLIINTSKNKELLTNLSKNAKKKASEYSIEKIARKFDYLYRILLNKNVNIEITKPILNIQDTIDKIEQNQNMHDVC